MKGIHQKSPQEVMEILEVTSAGLNNVEVENRREKYGFNELSEGKKKTAIQIFFEQFKDLLVIILLSAAIISMFLGNVESALVIFSVVILNAVLGTVQYIKAEQSLNSLKALSSPKAKVLRNGEKIEIASREITVGDIAYLDAGDYVSADGRIIDNYSIQVNESPLTGESEPVIKTTDIIEEENAPIGDRKNMIFAGSLVTYGRATMVITDIGMGTEVGKIASLLENTKEKKTPLQVSLDDFGKKLSGGILVVAALIFALNMYRGYPLVDSFMFAVALAVAAIPEALSSIVTIVLALGTQKMAKENAIIRKLQAVESLGSVSIICSDKTGTLTQNKMTVKKLLAAGKLIEVDKIRLENRIENQLITMSILCSDAVAANGKEIGDPTEVALVNLGKLYNMDELKVRETYPRLDELPFDSDRKLMSTVHNISGKTLMYTKGALDVLLNRTISIATSDGVRKFNVEDKRQLEKVNEKLSKEGLRVLAFAYKEINDETVIDLSNENDFVFAGLIAMMDPPREESASAVAACIEAGIKPVMITGDHKITAVAIAKQIGILKADSEAIEGVELDKVSDEKLREMVESISVYARVSPEHKIRIVRAWQERGNVVAMTGDGVNDAPALKQAHIGIAMGITGTEVAKDASSMVLTDDNFATIVKAVSNGRNIYSNIKNSIKFLLSGNTGGVLSVLYTSIMALPIPFAAVHLLFVNLLTDSLPAIALGLEPHKRDVMKEKPRDINSPILTKEFGLEVLIEGVLIAIATMMAFHFGLERGGAHLASTMAFATLSLARLLHGFNCRAKASIFKIGVFSNKFAWAAFGTGLVLLNSVLLIEPLRGIFEVTKLSLNQYLSIYVFSAIPFFVVQSYKMFFVKEEGASGFGRVSRVNTAE
jgi:Ca2+-transporting ATPase